MPVEFAKMNAWRLAERAVCAAAGNYRVALQNRHVVEPLPLQALADLLQTRLVQAHDLYVDAMQELKPPRRAWPARPAGEAE